MRPSRNPSSCTSSGCRRTAKCWRRSCIRFHCSCLPITPRSRAAQTSTSQGTSRSPSRWSDGSRESVHYLGADEAVADAAHRLDARIMSGRREREAQPADVDVDRALFDEYVIAPDVVEQPGARIDAPRVGDQELQQPEFGGPQVDFF